MYDYIKNNIKKFSTLEKKKERKKGRTNQLTLRNNIIYIRYICWKKVQFKIYNFLRTLNFHYRIESIM